MIAELDIDSRALQAGLASVDDVAIEVEQLDSTDAVPMRNLFWAYGDDLDRFDAALAEDPTVSEATMLADADGGRLYAVEYSEDIADARVYQTIVDRDAAVLSATTTGDGWDVRMSLPDRDALDALREVCEDNGIAVELQSIYSEDRAPPGIEHELTPEQREALAAAGRMGYFEIPRDAGLTDIADELGVSEQAASERLRRGLDRLVEGTVLRNSN